MSAGGRNEAAQGQLTGFQRIDTSLQTVLERFGHTVAEREKQECEKPKAPQKAEVIQLPLWPEPTRGVANIALRSALFAAVDPKKRQSFTRKIVAVQKGFEIRFTGIQLCQSDLDVWEQALHLARLHPLGNRCEFTAYSFLKGLGRPTGKSQHEWLKDVFARLHAASVEITKGGEETYFGHLIDEGAREESTGHYVLKINPKLTALYAEGWTAIDWAQRRRLQRKPLALWLHGFLSTHAKPHPIKIESLMQWSGSQTKERWKFKQNLKAALEELKTIGALVDYHFDGDLLHVERVPSLSQQKHLASQAKTHR
jgi:hypothetical protein